MKTSELMIGDWVLAQFINGDRYAKIAAIAIDCTVVSVDEREYNHDYESVLPIHLTEEILKKNLFEISNVISKEYTYKDYIAFNNYRFVSIMVDDYNDRFILAITNIFIDTHKKLGMEVKYVHELQQALRLCGISYLADDFKII